MRKLPRGGLPEHQGELVGGRLANLLPGVWSTRTPLKIENRRCEAWLEGWAEPWSAFAQMLGAMDERSSLRIAWRALLANQAHDSICGCSCDRVHEQMQTRYQTAHELAVETTHRALERVAGLGPLRQTPATGEIEIAVFNPSPTTRTDRVRLSLDGFPAFTPNGVTRLLALNMNAEGFEVDGIPARKVALEEMERPRPISGKPVFDLEFIARDVPALGWKRFALTTATALDDEIDEGHSIACGDISVSADERGRLDVRIGEMSFRGLAEIEDVGDRGDTYDFDALERPGAASPPLESVSTLRRRHPSGMQELEIRRVLRVPECLDPTREARSEACVALPLTVIARLHDGVPRVDLEIICDNTARDHRLRLLFPTRTPVESFEAATTFGRITRSTRPANAENWIHPAPATFPHQGWLTVSGLTVAAPGLPEAEVTGDGTIALTLVRSTGWLSRPDLRSRPGEAGPNLATPGAQCLGAIRARLSLHVADPTQVPARAREAELGLLCVPAGPDPLVSADESLLRLDGEGLLLCALKPAEQGPGMVLRILNPLDEERQGRLVLGFDLAAADSLRLDETSADPPLEVRGREVGLTIPPHTLRTIRLIPTK